MVQSKSLKTVFDYKSWVHAVAGATGSVVAMTVFYPLDTVRSRLQIEDVNKRKSERTIQVLKELINQEGVLTLYRGLLPVLESICISNFVYFYTFHSLKTLASNSNKQTAIKDLFLGALAGIVNVLTTTPFWVVNTRLKLQGINNDHNNQPKKNYNGLIEGLIFIAKTEGIKGLWAGTIPSLMLVVNPALQFMLYEAVKRKITKIFGEEVPSIMYFLIGALAKTFSTLITYPIQLIQTKQRHGEKNENLTTSPIYNLFKMMADIFNKYGFKGLYRGIEAKLLQTVLTTALMFAAYEKIAKSVTSILLKKS